MSVRSMARRIPTRKPPATVSETRQSHIDDDSKRRGGHVPWTSDVGIDARGATNRYPSLPRRW